MNLFTEVVWHCYRMVFHIPYVSVPVLQGDDSIRTDNHVSVYCSMCCTAVCKYIRHVWTGYYYEKWSDMSGSCIQKVIACFADMCQYYGGVRSRSSKVYASRLLFIDEGNLAA